MYAILSAQAKKYSKEILLENFSNRRNQKDVSGWAEDG